MSNKTIIINSENQSKGIKIELPKEKFGELLKKNYTIEDFNEKGRMDIYELFHQDVKDRFLIEQISTNDQTISILVKPRNAFSQNIFKTYIAGVFGGLGLTGSKKLSVKLTGKGENIYQKKTNISFNNTKRDGFDINLAE